MPALDDLIFSRYQPTNWAKLANETLQGLFGTRYRSDAIKTTKVRAPEMRDSGLPFAALIHTNNPDSGPYGGTSFVLFPIPDGPAMIALGVGTQGLSPEEEVLGRPGHARNAAAVTRWLNRLQHGPVVA